MWKWLYGAALLPKADRLSTYAVALAYCFVLSMVPFLAVTFALGMVISTEFSQGDLYAQQYAEVLHEIIPTESAADIARIFDAVRHSTQGGFVTLGFVLALYTSFTLMDQIFRTLRFIFDDPRLQQDWSIHNLVKAVALMHLWMFLLLLISISAVEATVVGRMMQHFLFSNLIQALLTVVQLLVVIGALFGTFYLTYYMVPTKAYRKNLIVEGSLIASCGWVLCSLVFAYILPKILATSAAYSALGSVFVILLWAQACAWSIIIGACWIVRFSTR